MTPDLKTFPTSFLRASKLVWGVRAREIVIGMESTLRLKSEASVAASKAWLALHKQRQQVFLTEAGLKMICRTVGMTGKLVDLVGQDLAGSLLLVEAKSILDSAKLTSAFEGVGKFENSIEALRKFYEKGGEIFPTVSQLIVTARIIRISTRSEWFVDRKNATLSKGGVPITVAGVTVIAHEVPFPSKNTQL